VDHDLADRLLEGARHDADAGALVARELETVEGLRRAQQRHADAGHGSFLDGRPRGVERILDPRLLLLHLGLGGEAGARRSHGARDGTLKGRGQ
jgi:hypothetical protein